MLGGIDPIIIFQVYKNVDLTTTADPCPCAPGPRIPITSTKKTKVTVALIPIYLSEQASGLYIDDESKNIDIDTEINPLAVGTEEGGLVNQKPLGSITTINLKGKQDSLGLTILLALSEMILGKVVSQEYEVTYMHGAVTVFGGLIHSFSFDQNSNDDLIKIKFELSRGRPKGKSVEVGTDPNAARLGTSGVTPPTTAPTVTPSAAGSSGRSVIQPNVFQPRL